ncbi:methyltransferase domain-containing protein [Luteolibacter marinus]|uniref:methyltransferase domain-containing protein n=1 Tax=Luteolibacter marinus TaxID=2776705 RepID=UPI001866BB09|nr:methyltransferase domain-containing protein [Luteolibacter marinus]
MIRATTTGEDVATHYDELDPLYRKLWGEHVHHGLWETGRESAGEAVDALSRHVARQAGIRAGTRVCDVGCGYGATARLLAEEFGATVTGITISEKQYHGARAHGGDNPAFLLGDWLANDLPDASFDAVIAIESTEHLPDVARGIAEMARVLQPGGKLVICAWMAGPDPEAWELKHLLEPICREGRLVGMGNEHDYRRWLLQAGLHLDHTADLSDKVRKTWPICIRRTVAAFFRDREMRQFLLDDHQRNRVFAVTLVRIWMAYLTGAMRYAVFTAEKP